MKKMSGLRLSVLTVLGVTSLSSNVVGSYTSNVANSYCYEAVSVINDECGELCLSSNLSEQVVGDVWSNRSSIEENYWIKHEKKAVQLQITNISKHVSKFDFEEEYEEL